MAGLKLRARKFRLGLLCSKDDKSGDLEVLELFSGVGVGCHRMKSRSVAADVSDWFIMPLYSCSGLR